LKFQIKYCSIAQAKISQFERNGKKIRHKRETFRIYFGISAREKFLISSYKLLIWAISSAERQFGKNFPNIPD
jgi:hypothetical protein